MRLLRQFCELTRCRCHKDAFIRLSVYTARGLLLFGLFPYFMSDAFSSFLIPTVTGKPHSALILFGKAQSMLYMR